MNKPGIYEFSQTEFTHTDFLCAFGCFHMEERIMKQINEALRVNRIPEFIGDYSCYCHTDRCDWNGDSIINRLKEVGIWQAIEVKLAYRKWCERCHLYSAPK